MGLRYIHRAVVAAAVAAAAASALVASAGAISHAVGHLTAVSGEWHASLSFMRRGAGPSSYSDLHLALLRNGSLVLDTPVVSGLQGTAYLQPGGHGGNKSLFFHDLDGDSVPELLLSLFTGGAHCCWIEQVYDLSGASPRKAEISLADAGASIVGVSGHALLRAVDDSFAYQFTDYADSGSPIRLWAYSHSRFTNITRKYPALITGDAAFWWKGYRSRLRSHEDERGILAAWAADEALLGRAAGAKRTLLRIAFDGALDWGFGQPKGSTYVRRLWAFLAREGYLT